MNELVQQRFYLEILRNRKMGVYYYLISRTVETEEVAKKLSGMYTNDSTV